jgi:hypothetical protein
MRTTKKVALAMLAAAAATGASLTVASPANASTPNDAFRLCPVAIRVVYNQFGIYDTAALHDGADGFISYGDLATVANHNAEGRDKKVKMRIAAARYFFNHPAVLNALDTRADEGGSPDGRISRTDVTNFIAFPPSLSDCR